jgi:hypothetical protein
VSASLSPRTHAMIHNRHLPMWLHRACCGVLGTVFLAGLGSIWFGEPPGNWRYLVSRCLFWGSVPLGIVLACIAHRFSIVQGLAGGEGYDELQDQDEAKLKD